MFGSKRSRSMEAQVKAVPLGAKVRGWFGSWGALTSEEQTIVQRAREIITDQQQFSRLYFARDEGDQRVDFSDPRAAKFCAVGALERAAFEMTGDKSAAYDAADRVQEALHGPKVPGEMSRMMEINDREGHEAVLRVFDAALEGRKVEHDERK